MPALIFILLWRGQQHPSLCFFPQWSREIGRYQLFRVRLLGVLLTLLPLLLQHLVTPIHWLHALLWNHGFSHIKCDTASLIEKLLEIAAAVFDRQGLARTLTASPCMMECSSEC